MEFAWLTNAPMVAALAGGVFTLGAVWLKNTLEKRRSPEQRRNDELDRLTQSQKEFANTLSAELSKCLERAALLEVTNTALNKTNIDLMRQIGILQLDAERPRIKRDDADG